MDLPSQLYAESVKRAGYGLKIAGGYATLIILRLLVHGAVQFRVVFNVSQISFPIRSRDKVREERCHAS